MVLSLLIREIEKRGRAQGLSVSEIAATIGVDRTRLAHIRHGDGRLSIDSLHEIVQRYHDDLDIRELVLSYLAMDIDSRTSVSREARATRGHLDGGAHELVRRLLRSLPQLIVSGGGLRIEDGHHARLAAILTAVEETVRALGIGVLRERAGASLSLARRQAMLAVPVLIVEAASALREPVEDVLLRRAETSKLTIAAWRPVPGVTPLPPLDTYRPLRLPRLARVTC